MLRYVWLGYLAAQTAALAFAAGVLAAYAGV